MIEYSLLILFFSQELGVKYDAFPINIMQGDQVRCPSSRQKNARKLEISSLNLTFSISAVWLRLRGSKPKQQNPCDRRPRGAGGKGRARLRVG